MTGQSRRLALAGAALAIALSSCHGSEDPRPAPAFTLPPSLASGPARSRASVDREAPTRPARLEAAASPGAVDLVWTASEDDKGVAGYELFRGEALVATTSGTAARETGLAPGRNHCYTVRSFDAAGNRSPPSARACARTPEAEAPPAPARDDAPPTAPAALASDAAPGKVTLRWEPAADDVGVVGYEVLRAGQLVAQVAGTTAAEAGLRAGRAHCYLVRAIDAAGNRSPPAGPSCATPPDVTPPSAPALVLAAAPSETEMMLRWSPSADDVGIETYELYRDEVLVARPGVTNAKQGGLKPFTRYCYTVVAVDAAGNRSPHSPLACAATPDRTPPSAPSGLEVAAEADRAVTIRWASSTDNVGVVRYVVRRAGTEVAIAAEGLSATERGLLPGREACYTVSAFDAAGNESPPAGPVCAAALDRSPPTRPEGLAAAARSAEELVLAWSPSTDDLKVTGYEVLDEGRVVARSGAPNAVVGGLLPAVERCFAVRAHDAAGNRSEPSAHACATTAEPGTPAAPANLTARSVAEDQLLLSWDPSPDAGMVYVVYWDGEPRRPGPAREAGGPRESRIGLTGSTTLKVHGAFARAQHCYRVAAQDGAARESPRTFSVCAHATAAVSAK